MQIDYKIIRFNPQFGSILVEFFFEEEFVERFNFDIPLDDDGLFIVGDQLHLMLLGFFPFAHLQRRKLLKAGIPNADVIQSLVVQPDKENDK